MNSPQDLAESEPLEDWLHTPGIPAPRPKMSLAQALHALGWMDGQRLAVLKREDPKLLGPRCRELVARRLLRPEQLAQALARASGLPGVTAIDPERVPASFLAQLLEPSAPAAPPPVPARNLAELAQAFEHLHHAPVRTLREALEDMRLLAPATLERLALEDPGIFGAHRAQLVRRAILTRDELGKALARVGGIPEVDAARFEIARDAFDTLPARLARTRQVLPLGGQDEVYFVASGSPDDEELRKDLCAATGHTVLLVWGDSNDIVARLERVEQGTDGGTQVDGLEWTLVVPKEQRIDPVDEASVDVRQLVSQAENEVNAVLDHVPASAVGEQSGMARLVKRLVLDARKAGASDVHIENHPHEAGVLVRYRVDGELRPQLTLPAKLRAALVSRIKVMARLDIAERRRPQDGKIDFSEFGGERLELRVAILPTHDGMENVVLRLLGTAPPLPLADLGLQARDRVLVERLCSRSFGLLLAAGPTGSGKTTTLHSMLQRLNTDDRKIWTAEDPIEITQPGLNQVQVKPAIGFTFASAMRSFLRADPDVIMIGEIRDAETAAVAVEASLTGHLVLSTLHTNSAAESVARLLELGVDPLNFGDSLLGVVAQRLVRCLCPDCRVLQPLDAQAREALLDDYVGADGLSREEGLRRMLAAAGVDDPARLGVGVAKGCASCGGKGYRGRVGVYEILENVPALRELVGRHAPPSELQAAAVARGMRTLRHDAIEKALQGRIDLDQAGCAYR